MNTFKINHTQHELLEKYRRFSSKMKGEIIEDLTEDLLTELKYKYIKIHEEDMQYWWGDFIVMDREHIPTLIDAKASHTWQGIDKLALDYKHFLKGTKTEYVPGNSRTNDNKGYIHHLKADTVVAVNPKSKKLYIINDFQAMIKEILFLMDKYEDSTQSLKYLYDIEISLNRNDIIKDTIIINVPIHSMKTLGAEVIEYQLVLKDKKCDIIRRELKKAESVGSTHDF